MSWRKSIDRPMFHKFLKAKKKFLDRSMLWLCYDNSKTKTTSNLKKNDLFRWTLRGSQSWYEPLNRPILIYFYSLCHFIQSTSNEQKPTTCRIIILVHRPSWRFTFCRIVHLFFYIFKLTTDTSSIIVLAQDS